MHGRGSKINSWGYAGFSLSFYLPGFHFGPPCLSHSHMVAHAVLTSKHRHCTTYDEMQPSRFMTHELKPTNVLYVASEKTGPNHAFCSPPVLCMGSVCAPLSSSAISVCVHISRTRFQMRFGASTTPPGPPTTSVGPGLVKRSFRWRKAASEKLRVPSSQTKPVNRGSLHACLSIKSIEWHSFQKRDWRQ